MLLHKRPNNCKTPEKMDENHQVSDNGAVSKDDCVNNEVISEPTLKEVLVSLNRLHEKFDSHVSQLQMLQNITVAMDEKIMNLEEKVDCNSGNITSLNTNSTATREELTLLKNIIIKQNHCIRNLQNQTLELTQRSMRDNILFHGIPESKNPGAEDCVNLVTQAVRKMGFEDTLTFERIHRLGTFHPGMKYTRPIVGKLPFKQAESLLAKSRALPRGDFFITRQVPQELREKKKMLWEKAEHFKALDPKCKTKISEKGKLYVNGQLVEESFQAPQPRDLLSLNKTEREELTKSGPKLHFGISYTDKGSSFTASAAKVHSLKEARQAYTAFLLAPGKAAAAHNIGVYRLYNPLSAKTEEAYCDDGDHGAGKLIRNHLMKMNITNTAVFVSSTIGSAYLGSARHRLMMEAVDSAVSQLNQASV